MKVRLLRRTGNNRQGTVLDLPEPEAQWLLDKGRAEPWFRENEDVDLDEVARRPGGKAGRR